jgi:hypothetical protein
MGEKCKGKKKMKQITKLDFLLLAIKALCSSSIVVSFIGFNYSSAARSYRPLTAFIESHFTAYSPVQGKKQ